MSAKDPGGATFVGLVDLASEEMGGRALACSDDDSATPAPAADDTADLAPLKYVAAARGP